MVKCKITAEKEYRLGMRETPRSQQRYLEQRIAEDGVSFLGDVDGVQVDCEY